MNHTLTNTFKTAPAPVLRRENTLRIASPVRRGQIYQNEKGYWKVDMVSGGIADLIPVWQDGTRRPALDARVDSVASLTGPFYRLCPKPVVDRGDSDPVGWALIGVGVFAVVAVVVGFALWRGWL